MNIHKLRTTQLQEKLNREKLDGFFVSSVKNVFFITGFHQDRTFLLITRSKLYAFLPRMFIEHFKSVCDWAEIVIYENIYSDLESKIKELKLKKIAFDSRTTFYDEGKKLMDMGFVNVDGFFSEFRMVKLEEEFENIKKACKIAKKAFELIKPEIKAGVKEIEIARKLECIMIKLGASERSFETIVAFGSNSALPHHESSQRKLKKNEVVLIDFGCIYNRYCSDMTRTFFYGKPTDKFLKIYSIVKKAQEKAIDGIKEGVMARDIDKLARDVISENGYGQYFTHGTGHGVGLEIHEEPYLNTRSTARLLKGMTVTVEPGIYLYGEFGIRIEDSIYVDEKPVILTE